MAYSNHTSAPRGGSGDNRDSATSQTISNIPSSNPAGPYEYDAAQPGLHIYVLNNKDSLLNMIKNLNSTSLSNEWDNKFNNPASYIYSCTLIPFGSGSFGEDATQNFFLGVKNYGPKWNVYTKSVNNWIRTINMGTIKIPKYYDSFLDYGPYTSIQLYLPFIGFTDIDPVTCVGGEILVQYRVNITNGDCIAIIQTKDKNGKTKVINSCSGNCGINVPITVETNTRALNTALAVGKVALTAATAGAVGLAATALSAAAAKNNATSSYASTLAELTSSNLTYAEYSRYAAQTGAKAAFQQKMADQVSKGATFGANAAVSGLNNTVSSALQSVSNSAYSGDISGNMGLSNIRYIYAVVTRTNAKIPANYEAIYGIPSNVKDKVSHFSGFLQCGSVQATTGSYMTQTEKDAAIEALQSGVYLTTV